MRRFFIIVMIMILIITTVTYSYADDEIVEEEFSSDEFNEIMETATNSVNVPIINSRYAIIYDRTSRKSFIWKIRKYKV